MAPVLYYWIFTNIALFYVLVAYGLSLWGAYICWEVDEEEQKITAAMQHYTKNHFYDKEYLMRIREAGWNTEGTEMQLGLLTHSNS